MGPRPRFGKVALASLIVIAVVSLNNLQINWFGPDRLKLEQRQDRGNDPAATTTTTTTTTAAATTQPGLARIAYLITVNGTSPRTVRSQQILESVVFQVELELAPPAMDDDKVYSNKLAHLAAFTKIQADTSREWGYIFEDDIELVGKSKGNWTNKISFSVEQDLVNGIEKQNPNYVYLGICAMNPCTKQCCGKCAHAYGISRAGVDLLVKYDQYFVALPRHGESPTYMDVVMNQWCLKMGGFPVLHGNLPSLHVAGHYGAFVQDRTTFKTMIG